MGLVSGTRTSSAVTSRCLKREMRNLNISTKEIIYLEMSTDLLLIRVKYFLNQALLSYEENLRQRID